MAVAVAEDWVRAPLKRFVDDGRLLLAILLRSDGQVLGQHGFSRSVDVMSACALAAGIYASAGEVGRMLEGKPFHVIHHVGAERQLFMAPTQTQRGSLLVLVTVAEARANVGLIRVEMLKATTALAAAGAWGDK